jgi:hypothetical protein
MTHQSTSRLRDHGMRRVGVLALALCTLLIACAVTPVAFAAARPAGTLKIASGASYTSSTAVTLTSSVTGATQMRVRDAGGVYTAWEPFAVTSAWTLPTGSGLKQVQVQYRRTTGKSSTLSASITLDTLAPVTTDDADGLPHVNFLLVLSPTDAASGVALTEYRIDGGVWTTGTVVALKLHLRKMRSGLCRGAHTIEYRSTDQVGNVETIESCQVILGS